ncbi:hypothetical protein ACYULU_14020 [Breznakiellaceae bacterium SP9]
MKTGKIREIMTRVLLVMLITSLLYGLLGIIFSAIDGMVLIHRSQIEYIKISLQCLLGLVALFLPSALEKKLEMSFSNVMHIFFVVFLFSAIILGEVRGFYQTYFHWDTVLHTLSGVMLSSFGFCIIDIINQNKKINLGLSDGFMSFFSFCFAITLDTIWEIIEFSMDVFMDLNMQQYILPDGVVLIGHYAVVDTMKDLIVDVLGALAISIIGFTLLKKRKFIFSVKQKIE